MPSYNSIAGIAIQNGACLVAKRLPPGEMSHKWEFPGGKVEADESDQEALVREFEEEFSVTIKVGSAIGKTFFCHNGCRYELRAYEIFMEAKELVLRVHSHAEWQIGRASCRERV